MLIYNSNSFDPYFNIATEEYLFKQKQDDFFLLYRNDPSVIIGKHQNAFAEANLPFVHSQNIPLIRRLSGGGTVYHDPGNINFSFIVNKPGKNLVDFKKHIQPVFELLLDLKIDVTLSKRNDLFIKDKKISGNAEHIFKSRVLHHGTILFNSDLSNLRNTLDVDNNSYQGKAITSIRNAVDNLSYYLADNLSIEEFSALILHKIESKFDVAKTYELKENDALAINQLVNEKYKTWKWNYAYSPDFVLNKKLETGSGYISNRSLIQKGIITEIELKSDFISTGRLEELRSFLLNRNFEFENIIEILNSWKAEEKRLIKLFF